MSKQLLDYAGQRIMFLGSVEGKLGQRSTHGPQKQRENFLENQINLLIFGFVEKMPLKFPFSRK